MKNGSTCKKQQTDSHTSLTLLTQVKQNERRAWSQLVALYGPVIDARCRQVWHFSPADAENVSQDVFAAVVKKIGEFDRQRTGSFRKWIRTITDNKCKDYLAKASQRPDQGGTTADISLEHYPDPEGSLGECEDPVNDGRTEIMNKALAMVKGHYGDRDLEIFWNVIVEGRNRQDVASQMGVSDNVVYIVCSRIRKKLRRIFDDLIDPDLLQEN